MRAGWGESNATSSQPLTGLPARSAPPSSGPSKHVCGRYDVLLYTQLISDVNDIKIV